MNTCICWVDIDLCTFEVVEPINEDAAIKTGVLHFFRGTTSLRLISTLHTTIQSKPY
jgi:hypothetical protein